MVEEPAVSEPTGIGGEGAISEDEDFAIPLQLKERMEQEKIEHREEWLYLHANCLRLLLRKEDAHKAYAQLLQEFPEKKYAEAATYEKGR